MSLELVMINNKKNLENTIDNIDENNKVKEGV